MRETCDCDLEAWSSEGDNYKVQTLTDFSSVRSGRHSRTVTLYTWVCLASSDCHCRRGEWKRKKRRRRKKKWDQVKVSLECASIKLTEKKEKKTKWRSGQLPARKGERVELIRAGTQKEEEKSRATSSTSRKRERERERERVKAKVRFTRWRRERERTRNSQEISTTRRVIHQWHHVSHERRTNRKCTL